MCEIAERRGVFDDLFLFNGRFDAGKHFYDNAVLRQVDLTQIWSRRN